MLNWNWENIIPWIFSSIGLAGTLINAEKNKWGFVFWLVSNAYMTIRFFTIGEYAQSALFLVYFILAIRGIVSWTKKEKNEKKENASQEIYEV